VPRSGGFAGALATARAQRARRGGGAQIGVARAKKIVHGLLGRDPRMARGANAQVIVNGPALGVGQLAVDERRDERIEILAAMH
jgi:hypothetical protein